MPGDLGATVVTMLVCFFISHARLRALFARPAFPTPSSGERFCPRLGRVRAAGRWRCVNVDVLAVEIELVSAKIGRPLPLWERSDRIDRCDPGEGLRSI